MYTYISLSSFSYVSQKYKRKKLWSSEQYMISSKNSSINFPLENSTIKKRLKYDILVYFLSSFFTLNINILFMHNTNSRKCGIWDYEKICGIQNFCIFLSTKFTMNFFIYTTNIKKALCWKLYWWYNVWNKNICLQYYVIQYFFLNSPKFFEHTSTTSLTNKPIFDSVFFLMYTSIRKERISSESIHKSNFKGDEIIRETAKRKWIIRTKQSIGIYVNRVTKWWWSFIRIL